MKIALLGATGRTGQLVASLALAEGHALSVLVREPAKLGPIGDRASVITGSATDQAAIDKTVAGTEVVISTLGHAADSASDVMTRAIANTIASMDRHAVKRIVVLSNVSLAAAGDAPDPIQRLVQALFSVSRRARASSTRATGATTSRIVLDHRGQAKLLAQSDLDWTVVRAAMLTDSSQPGPVKVGGIDSSSGKRTSHQAVAGFLLKVATDGGYSRETPFISQ